MLHQYSVKDKYQVDTKGLRGELPLTDSQKDRISKYIKLIESGAPFKVGVIRWIDDREMNTAYSPGFDLLNVGTDVMPATQPKGQGTLTANTRLTWKSSIAHELVGHREAALRGNTQLETPLFRSSS